MFVGPVNSLTLHGLYHNTTPAFGAINPQALTRAVTEAAGVLANPTPQKPLIRKSVSHWNAGLTQVLERDTMTGKILSWTEIAGGKKTIRLYEGNKLTKHHPDGKTTIIEFNSQGIPAEMTVRKADGKIITMKPWDATKMGFEYGIFF